jgi:hypothetical protein
LNNKDLERYLDSNTPRPLNRKYYNEKKAKSRERSQAVGSFLGGAAATGLGALALVGAGKAGAFSKILGSKHLKGLSTEYDTFTSSYIKTASELKARMAPTVVAGARSTGFGAELWKSGYDENVKKAIWKSVLDTDYTTGSRASFSGKSGNEFIDKILNNAKLAEGTINNELRNTVRSALVKGYATKTDDRMYNAATEELRKLALKKGKDSSAFDVFVTKTFNALGYTRVTNKDAINLRLFKTENVLTKSGTGRATKEITPEVFLKNNPDFDNLYISKAVFKDKKGNVIDLRKTASMVDKALKVVSQHTQIPLVKLNPLNIFQYPLLKSNLLKDPVYLANPGEKLHAGISMARGQPIHDSYVLIGKKLIDSQGNVKKGNYTAYSAGIGMPKRLLSKVIGEPAPEGKFKSAFLNKLDLGKQDETSIFKEIASIFKKFSDPDWERNQVRNIISGNLNSEEYVKRAHSSISSLINDRTKSLNNKQLAEIEKLTGVSLKDIFGVDKIDMDSKEGVFKIFEKMANSTVSSPYSGRIKSYWDDAIKTGKDFGKAERIMDNQALIWKDRRIISEFDDLKDTISKEIMFHTNRNQTSSIIGRTTDQDIINWDFLSRLDEKGHALRKADVTPQAFEDYSNFLKINKDQAISMVDKYTSPFQVNVIRDTGIDHMYADQIKSSQTRIIVRSSDIVETINETIMAKSFAEAKESASHLAGDLGNFFKEMFFGGRKRPDDFTTASMFGMFFAERNNRLFSKFAIGLGRDSMGSTAETLSAMLLKRALPVLGGIAAFSYLNMESENITGTNPKEIAAEVLAGEQLLVTGVRDILGETERAKRRREIRPGYEMLVEEHPFGAMQLHALGITGDDTMSELYDYQRNGQVAIRKGRWWPIGSSTPWRGEKIDRYEDTWYQKAHQKDAKAISLYGSEEGAFEYSWLPNPRNPFGPITPLLLDPYKLETDHYYDRPYMQTGPVQFLEDVPLIGPILSTSVGNAFKPPLPMHMQDIADLNKQTKEDGNPQMMTYQTAVSKNIQLGYGVVDGRIVGQVENDNKWIITEPIEGTAKEQARKDLIAQNEYIKAVGGTAPSGRRYMGGMSIADTYSPGVGAEFLPISRSFTIPELEANYEELMTQADPRYALGELTFRRTEFQGIFGFAEGNIFYGGNDKVFNKGPIIQRGMYESINDSFWDQDLGGLTGDFSEGLRRFVPKPRRADYFNPIPNTMPDWIPGESYFINFRTGDPFTKIKKGEWRLPGAGYEANNELHPDQFGEYGAFDRMKILADVAPWSQEYSYWSQYVTHNELDPEIRAEAAEIKRQVTSKKKKYEFFEKDFKNSAIEKQKVHVTTVLDANTFLTKEYPDNPIRLAGVRVNKDNEHIAFKHIKTGATLKIGYDPNDKIQDDTLKTIRATVWKGSRNLNKEFIDRQIGTEKETDMSPAGIHARFEEKEISKGKNWERFAHMNTPIHNKYLPIRSAIEEYERDQVYGESWQSWDNPISGWLAPTFRNLAQSPIPLATIGGGALGVLWGATRKGQVVGGAIGAGIGLTTSVLVTAAEIFSGDAWIPKPTREKRELDEYFDKLQYIKSARLFEQAKRRAFSEEGVDVDQIIADRLERSENNKRLRDEITENKRQFLMRGAPQSEVAQFNQQLNDLKEGGSYRDIGPYTMLALKYKQDMGATVYGVDEESVWLDTYKALPVSDRPFFMEFMTAKTEKERKRILKLVPEDQRRIYQSKFGMKMDKKERIEDYFQGHYLPSENWAGWLPDVYLDDIKYKVVQNEGLDATEFGLWDDNAERAKILNIKDIEPDRPRKLFKSEAHIRGEINKIMRGYNMSDIIIDIQKIPNSIGVDVDVYVEDSAIDEFRRKINEDPTIIM